MDNENKLTNRLSLIGWGMLLIWWGLRWSILAFLPNGSGLIGTGLILLGASVVRKSARMAPNSNNIFFGLFSILSGGVLFVADILDLAYQPPVLETLMIILGVLLLGYVIFSANRRYTES